jgi:hypothetical protein
MHAVTVESITQGLMLTLQLNRTIAKEIIQYAKSNGGSKINLPIFETRTAFMAASKMRGADGLTYMVTAWEMEPYIDWSLWTSLIAMLKLSS